MEEEVREVGKVMRGEVGQGAIMGVGVEEVMGRKGTLDMGVTIRE